MAAKVGAAKEGAAKEGAEKTEKIETLLATPDLAEALESEQFRRFLDQIPIAIVVSEMKHGERIVYANPEFEKLSGQAAADLVGGKWDMVNGKSQQAGITQKLGLAIADASDFVGTFMI